MRRLPRARSVGSNFHFVRNKLVTTTFQYDKNGNLIQKTTDGTSTTYVYDYANRLIALGVGGATTTYGYDAFGQRVVQTGTSTTTIYPVKWYSIASSTATGARYSTTTEYVFNGDTLLATVDQQIAYGVATGSPQTLYIHPDHLGSTNVVTNASGTLVQTLDYYPYGATRISWTVGGTDSARKFIGQFSDQSNLSYLNARYYESTRGQFISQDPVFWEIGLSQDGKNALSNPQALNSYGYANDNPITGKDPNGRQATQAAQILMADTPLLLMPQTWPVTVPIAIFAGGVIMYEGSSALFRQSGGREYGRLDRGQGASFPGTPDPFDPFPPNLGPKIPKWIGGSIVGGIAAQVGTDILQPYFDRQRTWSNVMQNKPGFAKSEFPNFFSSSNQTRAQAVNSFNSGSRASAPQDKLWVTPNGAVITWSGTVIAPAPFQNSSPKNTVR
jgi:RHS repeat-associated protein